MEFMQFEAESRAVSIGKPCRSLRKHHAAVSGIDVPLERNLQHHLTVLYNKNVLSEHELIWNKIGAYSTIPTDMPPHSNAYGEWNSTRYLNWAKSKGPNVYEVVYRIFASSHVEQQHYRTVHSILKLASSYSDQRLEEACRVALQQMNRPRYKDIKHILETGEDLCQPQEPSVGKYTRGGDYFGL